MTHPPRWSDLTAFVLGGIGVVLLLVLLSIDAFCHWWRRSESP